VRCPISPRVDIIEVSVKNETKFVNAGLPASIVQIDGVINKPKASLYNDISEGSFLCRF